MREATGSLDATDSTCASARPTQVSPAEHPGSMRGSVGASSGGDGAGGAGASAERSMKKREMKACVARRRRRRSTVSARAAATGSGRSRNLEPCCCDDDDSSGEKAETKLDARDASGSIGVRRCCMRCRVSIAAGAGKRES